MLAQDLKFEGGGLYQTQPGDAHHFSSWAIPGCFL